MLFNSIDFAVFLPLVFILYWFVFNKSIKHQNFLIVVSSYIFYSWWDWRFLILIFISSIVDYLVGIELSSQTNKNKRKLLLACSLLVNLGFLLTFKYYNFFLDNFSQAFLFFGENINIRSLNLVIPVGISFYTFQTLSYTIDIFNKKLTAKKDLFSFLAFVSFFPQLVAGPIERAKNLLPQFYSIREFSYNKSIDGIRQILWGLFKKIVIADNCAHYVNIIFSNSDTLEGSTLFLGAILFSFQIYGDFSGYSDIAIGTARLFGFNLMQNFAFPYFSRDIGEFWRRWHISLSTWFRDYVYIPLGGSRVPLKLKIRNIFIIFLVSGFWHGANWTFIAWGALHAIYFLPLMFMNKNRIHTDIVAEGNLLPSIKEFIGILTTYIITVFAWIFFRAETITQALNYISNIFSDKLFMRPEYFVDIRAFILVLFIILFVLIEWLQRDKKHALEISSVKTSRILRWTIYLMLIFSIILFGGQQQEFIYFQF